MPDARGSTSHSRGGRKPKKTVRERLSLPLTTPERPSRLNKEAAWYWDNFIVKATHLTEQDTPACIALVKNWAILHKARIAAEADPLDKETRISYVNYATLQDRLERGLCLDPLGRERATKTEPDESPLSQFGIAS